MKKNSLTEIAEEFERYAQKSRAWVTQERIMAQSEDAGDYHLGVADAYEECADALRVFIKQQADE